MVRMRVRVSVEMGSRIKRMSGRGTGPRNHLKEKL